VPDEPFSDAECQIIVVLVTEAWVRIRDDPAFGGASQATRKHLPRLAGDTKLIARKPWLGFAATLLTQWSTQNTSLSVCLHD
jgi:hypothetical protein